MIGPPSLLPPSSQDPAPPAFQVCLSALVEINLWQVQTPSSIFRDFLQFKQKNR